MPKLYPCTIIVMQEGKPLEGASVSLMPMDSNSRWSAGGVTDSKGKAQISVHGKYTGVAPGRYHLCINKIEVEPIDLEKYPRKAGTETPTPDIYDLIAPKFGNLETAQEVEVVTDGKNEWTVDVGSAVRVLVPQRKRQ